jgi:hypothetical protein
MRIVCKANPSRWFTLFVSGGAVFQLGGCADLAVETLVRIGFTALFLPINDALT